MQDLSYEWVKFGNIAFDENDCLAELYRDFEIGTDRMEIWHWFDNNHIGGIVDLMDIT